MSREYTASQYLGVSNSAYTLNNIGVATHSSIALRERGIVKTGRKPKSQGWVSSEQLDTKMDWSTIAYRDIKDWIFKTVDCPNCGHIHQVREDSLA